MKIGYIFDSSVGISKKEVEKLGHLFVPINITNTVTNEIFVDDGSYTLKELFRDIENGATFASSQPSPGQFIQVFDEAIAKFDKSYYISLSSELSGTFDSATKISKEEKYNGKIIVVDSYGGLAPVIQIFHEIRKHEQESESSIHKFIETVRSSWRSVLIPTNLKLLKKSGRFNSVLKYFVVNLLKIKIALKYYKSISFLSKDRTIKNLLIKIHNWLKEELFQNSKDKRILKIELWHTFLDKSKVKEYVELTKKEFGVDKVEIKEAPVTLACHIGESAFIFFYFDNDAETTLTK